MNLVLLALEGAWKVLLAGLLLGAGLPMLFTLGLKALSVGAGGEVISTSGVTVRASKPNAWGKPVAYVLFAVVVLAITLGITYIVAHGFGYSITWTNGIIPNIAKK